MTTMAGALIVIDTDTSAEVDAGEQLGHVVERVDGDAEPADLAERARVVAVEAHERRQVEGGAEAGLALVEQERKRSLVCRGVPKPANWRMVHSRLRYMVAWTPRVNGYWPGIAEVGVGVEAVEAVRRVERVDGHAADGGGRLLAAAGRRRLPSPSARGRRCR